jgi:hypothetical protein
MEYIFRDSLDGKERQLCFGKTDTFGCPIYEGDIIEERDYMFICKDEIDQYERYSIHFGYFIHNDLEYCPSGVGFYKKLIERKWVGNGDSFATKTVGNEWDTYILDIRVSNNGRYETKIVGRLK